MTNKPIVQKIVVAGVIFDRSSRVLLLQRNREESVFPLMWELPSGKREPLEKSVSALEREVNEETGLKIKILRPFSVFDYSIEKADEIRDSTQINFLALAESGEVVLSSEHQDFVWLKEEDLGAYRVSSETAAVIKGGFSIFKDGFQ